MKYLIKLIIPLCLFYSNVILSTEAVKKKSESYVWGQIVKTEKLSASGFIYYVLFNDGKSQVAYPIMANKKITTKQIEHYVGTMARIKGNIVTKKLYSGEFRKTIVAFDVTEIEALKLNELGVHKLNINSDNKFIPENKIKENNSGGIRINDDVANTLIFAGGASILGKIIYDSIKGH